MEVAVEANGAGLRRRLPLGGAEENADVRGANVGDTRRDGRGLDRTIDGGKDDTVAGDEDDDAAAG